MSKMLQLYGLGQGIWSVLPPPLALENAPNANQTNYEIGQVAYTPPLAPTAFYMYAGAGNWVEFATSSGSILGVLGSTNQITSTLAAGVATLSIPTTFIAPGTIAATTTVTAPTGFVSTTAGAGIKLNSGATAGTTTATLNGRSGQVTITTPTINAGATFTMTITNSAITASTTQVLYALTGGTTGSAITIQSVTNSAGQSVVVVQNASAVTNSTGSLVLTFLVLN